MKSTTAHERTERHREVTPADAPTVVVDSARESEIADLLVEWEERRERGESIEPGELCAECPELRPEIERRIRILADVDAFLEGGTPLDTLTDDESAGCRDLLPTLPGYEIDAVLGRGGMGVVYRGRQLGLDRRVAVKMIVAGEIADAEQIGRFRSEAEAVARLQHPHIVQIHDIGEHRGLPFFSMEFVGSGSLADALVRGPWAKREAAELVELLARAMQAAHDRGLVHRDLKPANVLLTGDGTPKIADFGLAKRLDVDSGHTRTGSVLGTPSYMSPEQARGDTAAVGPATDVYALGAILYELLTGRPPFRAPTGIETIKQVIDADPVPPTRLQTGVPRDLETICLKCLEKRPEMRYGSAGELADDLRRFLDDEPIRARPVGPWTRIVKFARRRPALTALGVVTFVSAVALIAVGTWYNAQLASVNDELESTNGALEEETRKLGAANGELVDALDRNQRLVALSYVAYGRVCALAAKEANLGDPLVAPPSRGANLSNRYERQFRLDYDLITRAGDPSVQPALDEFAAALQGDRDFTEEEWRVLALALSRACGEAWLRATEDSPELRDGIRRHLYERACAIVDHLARASSLREAQHEYAEFWELYYGELAIVESREVEVVMIRFGRLLGEWRELGADAAPGDLAPRLKELAEALHVACGVPATLGQ